VPTFVIHAGPHKTGTTYLQRCLDFNAARLRGRGIAVPVAWNHSPENPSHDGLIQRLDAAGFPELEATFKQWRAARVKTVVISSEDIATLPADSLAMLRSLVGSDPCVVVYYVRRWSELVASGWQEAVKQGASLPLLEYVLHRYASPEASTEINIEPVVERLIAAFGREAIRLVSYNQVLESGLDLFTHFGRNFLGMPNLQPIAEGRVNASLPPAEVELIRELNHIDRAAGRPQGSRISISLSERRGVIDISPLLSVLNDYTRTLLLRDNLPFAREILRRSRATYADCVVKPVPALRFYNPKDTIAVYVAPSYAIPAGFNDALHALRNALVDEGRPGLCPGPAAAGGPRPH
jgi:hypothetical protein